jgi:hypothetical protein
MIRANEDKPKRCKVRGCGAKPIAKDLCQKHYASRRRKQADEQAGVLTKLPYVGLFTRTSWTPPPDLSYEQWR